MLALYPYQKTGADWLAERARGCLFDEMGMGKTITAIRGAGQAGAHHILVLVPTVVLWNWEREFKRWAPAADVQVLESGRDQVVDRPRAAKKLGVLGPQHDVVVTTHGLILRPAIFSQLVARRWDLLVVDECHFFRGPEAKRTNRLYNLERPAVPDAGLDMEVKALADAAFRVWLLSGTPMPNHVGELWTHLRGLFPERIRNVKLKPASHAAFLDAYCVTRETKYGPKVVHNKNLGHLRKRLRGIVLRRMKKDHLKDLPPIRYELVTLKPRKMPWELKVLDGRLRPKLVEAAKEGLGDDAGPDAAWRALRGEEDFTRLRRMIGLAKLEPVVELLSMELESRALDKVVLFAHHVETISMAADALAKFGAIVITGATPARRRQDLIDAFQQRPSVRVAVCNIVAAGTGTTMTAAADVLFLEASFVPGENAQAAQRVHRIGQDAKVRVRFVALAGTSDEDLVRALRRKTEMIREVLN